MTKQYTPQLPPTQRLPPISPKTREQIKNLYTRKLLSQREICEKLKLDTLQVARIVTRYKLKPIRDAALALAQQAETEQLAEEFGAHSQAVTRLSRSIVLNTLTLARDESLNASADNIDTIAKAVSAAKTADALSVDHDADRRALASPSSAPRFSFFIASAPTVPRGAIDVTPSPQAPAP